jgi:predicted CopG family antitoxin
MFLSTKVLCYSLSVVFFADEEPLLAVQSLHQPEYLDETGILAPTKSISLWIADTMCMRTIEVSDTIYDEILSRRKGKESISKTIERELKPKSKVQADIDKLDADIARSKKTRMYTSAQVKKELGL